MSPEALNLCLNCLQPGAKAVEVGPEKGSQRDPYREQLPLCEACTNALLTGDFTVLSTRYSEERMFNRRAMAT